MAVTLAPLPDKTVFHGQAFLTPPDLRAHTSTRRLLLSRYDVAGYDDGLFPYFRQEMPAFLARAVPKRRAEFLAGRVLAAEAQAQFGLTPLPIDRDDRGAPLWPQGLRGSISHSHGCVGVWIGSDGSCLGLDIEALADTRATQAILHSVLTEADLALLGPTPDASLCTMVFSAKEALFKALYPRVRRFFGFDYAEVASIRTDGLTLRLTKALAPAYEAGLSFDIGQQWDAGRVISLCETKS